MGISFYAPDGTLLPDTDGGPWQYNAEGLNTGLERNSRPFENFIFNTRTYQLLYQHQLWVKVAVDKLTYQMARLPLKVYEGESAKKKRLTSGPLFESIRTPAPGKRTSALVQWAIKPALIQGASALRIVRNRSGMPTGYLPLYWQWLDPRTVDGVPDGIVDYYRYTPPNADPEILLPDDVVLLAWETADGRVGDSPLRPLLETLAIEYLAKRHMQQMLRNGVRPPGGIAWGDGNDELIKLAQNKEFRERFSEELNRLLGGTEGAGRPLNLPPGAKWQTFSYSNTEAELVDHRKLTVVEVAAAYDIAPPNIGWLEGMARSGLEVLAPGLFQVTIPPWLTLFQDAFGGQVIDRVPAFTGQSTEFDLGDVLRGDPDAEVNALKTAVLAGLRTINEARAKLNLPPSDDPHANELMFAENNMTFLGGMPMRDPASEPDASAEAAQAKAVLSNVQRVAERVYRRLKAGESPDAVFDAERFERELHDDLARGGANGSAAPRAKAFSQFVADLVTAADGDPDRLRHNFAPFVST